MTAYTRREKQRLTPEILGRYHALIMQGNLPEFEALLSQYEDHMPEETKRELIEEFTRISADALRRNWRSRK
jgi:hypothetical protein